MLPMEPIHDFSFEPELSDSCESKNGDGICFGLGAPHRRLSSTRVYYMGEITPSFPLCYRRRHVDGMQIFGADRLVLQLRTTHGFIVMCSGASGMFSSFSISIYYILDGFRGSEWGMFYGREKETPLAWVKRIFLKHYEKPVFCAPRGPEPLEAYRIEDDRNLAFKVHCHGWYRMTLFEENPRSWLVSNWRYMPENSYAGHRRYFCIRKIWGKGYDGGGQVLYPPEAQEEKSSQPAHGAALLQTELGGKGGAVNSGRFATPLSLRTGGLHVITQRWERDT
ncbi:hypothetical protein AAFN88_12790 [Pelagibius sp. CAU 1746]|uniref:hypothetical protein n=1 Tax=Pelagibius sp. CAU 1746 TaxID=3140370 RepID=UPI00325C15F3